MTEDLDGLTAKFNALIQAIGALGWSVSVPNTEVVEGLIIGTPKFIDQVMDGVKKVDVPPLHVSVPCGETCQGCERSCMDRETPKKKTKGRKKK
jgi:hypothetical protein